MAPVISTNVRKHDNNVLRCQNMYHICIVAHIYMELSRSTWIGCPFYVVADMLHVRRMFIVYFITRKSPVEATLVVMAALCCPVVSFYLSIYLSIFLLFLFLA